MEMSAPQVLDAATLFQLTLQEPELSLTSGSLIVTAALLAV